MNVHSTRSIVSLGELIAPAPVRRVGENDIPILSMTMHEGLVDQSKKFKKRVASADLSTYKAVEFGQLVVGFPIDEGVLAFQTLYKLAAVSPAYGIWNVKHPGRIFPRYLERFLRSPQAIAYYSAKLRSTTARRRSLPKNAFLDLPVPLPPLDEQERIAEILDKVDTLRRLRRRALDHLRTLGPAIFHEMFGAFKEGLEGWSSERIGDLVTSARIGLVRGAKDLKDDGGIPYLRMDSVQNGELRLHGLKHAEVSSKEYKEYHLRPGDLLFNTRNSRELVGKSAVLREPFTGVYNNNLLRLRFREGISASVIDAFFRTNAGLSALEERKSGTTNVFAIYQKALMDVEVPVPPEHLQRRFDQALTVIHKKKGVLLRGLKESEMLFASLQHFAFSGRL